MIKDTLSLVTVYLTSPAGGKWMSVLIFGQIHVSKDSCFATLGSNYLGPQRLKSAPLIELGNVSEANTDLLLYD